MKIVVNPDGLDSCAQTFKDAAAELTTLSARFRAADTSCMPAATASDAQSELRAAAGSLEALAQAYSSQADDLRTRAEIARLQGSPKGGDYLFPALHSLDVAMDKWREIGPDMVKALLVHPKYYRLRVRVQATTYTTKTGRVVARRAYWRKAPRRWMPKGTNGYVDGVDDAGKVIKLSEYAGDASMVFGFGVTAYDQWNADAGRGYSTDVRLARAGEVGATATLGAWAGAEVGGEAGATIGAFVGGPIGMAVGGVVGAGIGAIAGSSAGHWIGKEIISLF